MAEQIEAKLCRQNRVPMTNIKVSEQTLCVTWFQSYDVFKHEPLKPSLSLIFDPIEGKLHRSVQHVSLLKCPFGICDRARGLADIVN